MYGSNVSDDGLQHVTTIKKLITMVLQMESDVLNYKAPKGLGDIVESIVGSIFLNSGRDTGFVWQVFQPLFDPMVTPETLPMHPVRELQERCQRQAEGLEYKAT